MPFDIYEVLILYKYRKVLITTRMIQWNRSIAKTNTLLSWKFKRQKKRPFFYLFDKLAYSAICQIRFKTRAMTQTQGIFRKKGIVGQLALFPLLVQICI